MPLLWLNHAVMTLVHCLSNNFLFNRYLIIGLFHPEGKVLINEFPNC